jgi:hypothetical protein
MINQALEFGFYCSLVAESPEDKNPNPLPLARKNLSGADPKWRIPKRGLSN